MTQITDQMVEAALIEASQYMNYVNSEARKNRMRAALEAALLAAGEEQEWTWRDDPSADERWNAGCDFAMLQLCSVIGADPKKVIWDSATETLDGDVQSTISKIIEAGLGENWQNLDAAYRAARMTAPSPPDDVADTHASPTPAATVPPAGAMDAGTALADVAPPMVDLAPCPFCGGEAKLVDIGPSALAFAEGIASEDDIGSYAYCITCGASSSEEFGPERKTFENWNRRSLSTPEPGEAEAVATVIWYDPELYPIPYHEAGKIIDASLAFMDTTPIGTKLYAQSPGFREGVEAAAKVAEEDEREYVVPAQSFEETDKYGETYTLTLPEQKCRKFSGGRKIAQKIRALAPPAGAGEGWQPIKSAPKDGTHILAYRKLYGIRCTNMTNPPTVVHWFDDPDEPGFYTSINELAPEHPFKATHWQPLPAAPGDGG